MMNPLYHEFSMLQTKLIPRSKIEVKQEIASGTVYIRTVIACKSDPAKLPKINFSVALLIENLRPVLPF